jgi:hypothetical protein
MEDEEGDYDNSHNCRNTIKANNESNVCSLDEDDFDTDDAISTSRHVQSVFSQNEGYTTLAMLINIYTRNFVIL